MSRDRFDGAEITRIALAAGISGHPRFDGLPATNIIATSGAGNGTTTTTVTVYDPALLDMLAVMATEAAAAMRGMVSTGCPDDPDGLHHAGCGCPGVDPINPTAQEGTS